MPTTLNSRFLRLVLLPAAFALTLTLATLSLSACASRGGLTTPSTGLCSSVGALQALCSTPGEKPRAIAKVCDQAPIVLLLCGPSASLTPAVCPPPLPVGCISGVLSSQKGRIMTGTKRDLLAECATYLAQVQQCAVSEPAVQSTGK